jgi:NADH:ubiquinone oxidoreductase subunit 5 (subunit L)/multisubunit Na+/H+ antiporter MnhA subunit
MDAPVPASALIHSATLVAAGILLVLRIKPIVLVDSTTPTIFSYLSLITILVGGLAAVSHTDSKKILAYSTISNCGYMMFLAINAPESATLVFFIAHGLLKALSFICIGLLIIILKHKQDFKYGGDLANLYQMLFFVTTLSVCTLGSAPTTVLGIIKHQLFYTGSPCLTNIFITGLVFCIGGVTSFVYSIRLVTIIFISSRNRWSADRNNTNINPVNYSWRHFISGFVNRGFSTNIILIKVTAALVQTFIIILLLFFTYLRGLDIALVDSDFGVFILRSVERYGFYDYTTYSLPINLGVGRLVGLLQLGIMLSMTAPMWFGKKIKTTAPLYGHVWCLLAIITLLP